MFIYHHVFVLRAELQRMADRSQWMETVRRTHMQTGPALPERSSKEREILVFLVRPDGTYCSHHARGVRSQRNKVGPVNILRGLMIIRMCCCSIVLCCHFMAHVIAIVYNRLRPLPSHLCFLVLVHQC